MGKKFELAEKLALKLGQIETEFVDHRHDGSGDPKCRTAYAPHSVAYVVKVPKYEELDLFIVIAESGKAPVCAMMIVRKEQAADGVIFTNCLVRQLKIKTKYNSTLELPEDDPGESDATDVRLTDGSEDFFCGRFLVADPANFGLPVDEEFAAKILVLSDDSLEGELDGKELLQSVQERTPMGISPPGITQPRKKSQSPPRTILRKKA